MPTLDWSDVGDYSGVLYHLRLYKGTPVLTLVEDWIEVSESRYEVPPQEPLEEGTYYWDVRVADAAGNMSDWTAPWSFTVDVSLPAAPSLLSPEDGDYTNNTTPEFDWTDVYDPSGTTYDLQVDDDDLFGNPEVDVTGVLVSAYTLVAGEALAEGAYYWRVRTMDGGGNQSDWTLPWLLNIDTTEPEAPTLLSPVNGVYINNQWPTFDWGDVTEDPSGVYYDLWIDDNDTFATPVLVKTGLTDSEYTLEVGEALPEGEYFWRVKSRDGAGNDPLSEVWSFGMDVTEPDAPTLLSPVDAAFINDQTPTLNWGDVSDRSGVLYALEVDVDDDPLTAPLLERSELSASEYTPEAGEELPEGEYYWRVKSYDGAGNDPWSVVWSFTVDVTEPAAPTLVSPQGGAHINDPMPTLDWEDVLDPSGVSYTLEVDIDDDPLTTPRLEKSGLTISEYTLLPGEALVEGAYYWRVKSYDGAGNDPWSGYRSLEVDFTAPPKPGLLSPEDGVGLEDNTPTFDWTDVLDNPSAVSYSLQVDNDSDFSSLVLEKSGLAASEYTVGIAEYLPGGDYYWRVKAEDSAGNASVWTTPWRLSILIYIVPLDTTFSDGWNLFSIPLEVEPNNWEFQIGDDVSPLYVYKYDTLITNYLVYPIDPFDIEAGVGYWVKVDGDTLVDAQGYLLPNAPFHIQLLGGWNLFGQPFNYSVSLADVQVYNPATAETVSLEEAHARGWLLNFVYHYVPAISNYEYYTAPTGQLDPWKGYWIKAVIPVELVIQPVAVPSVVTDWTQVTTAHAPSARTFPLLAFDSSRNRTVLFGGYDGANRADTWEYDGADWTEITTTHSPGAITYSAVTFDSSRNRVVLFGGMRGSSVLNETWEYDGSDWTQIATSHTPGVRAFHSLCFDSSRNKVVLFGGTDGGSSFSDTWEYDGTDWIQVTTSHSPSGRYKNALAFDSSRNKVVLFGGNDGPDLSDTWEYDGTDWTQIAPSHSPSARTSHASMAFDGSRNRVVLFGGAYGPQPYSRLGDTWEYDGTDWTEIIPSHSPTARHLHAMAFDSGRSRAVLFGGYDGYGRCADTWEYCVVP
ncbi:kelch repeat-containing protein [Chloroflexota bacterium]